MEGEGDLVLPSPSQTNHSGWLVHSTALGTFGVPSPFEATWIGLSHVGMLPGNHPAPGEVMSLIAGKTDGNPLCICGSSQKLCLKWASWWPSSMGTGWMAFCRVSPYLRLRQYWIQIEMDACDKCSARTLPPVRLSGPCHID